MLPPSPAYTIQAPPSAERLEPETQPDKEHPEWARAWWDSNVVEPIRAATDRWRLREQWQRRLHRRQALEVEAAHPRGIDGRLRVQQDPPHPFYPSRPQDHEVGLDGEWLSEQGDGATMLLSSGTRSGQYGQLTATAALDAQRHASGRAALQMGTYDPLSLKLDYSKRQHNLLLARQVEHRAGATFDMEAGACQLSSSTSTRCCSNTLTVTAMAGTDLTHTDCGLEAVFLPPPSVPVAQPSDSSPQAAPPADAAAGSSSEPVETRGLKRAMVAAVTSLDGMGKQLCLESSHCIAGNGCRLDITAESREEAGLRRLLQPEAWSLQLCSPALAGAKALQATLRGGAAELAPSASVRLTPADGPCSGGLSVGASCRLGPNGGAPALDAEWRSGDEEQWVVDGSMMVRISGELVQDWSSSRVTADLLLTH